MPKAATEEANLKSPLGGKEVKPVVEETYDPMPVGQPPTATLPANKSLGSFRLKTSSGKNSTHFTGRVKRKPLRLGSYRLAVAETDSDGHKGKATARAFRIVR